MGYPNKLGTRISGSVTFHQLGDLVVHFIGWENWIELKTDLAISDVHYAVISVILAKELGCCVYWQDMCGLKHWVSPKDPFPDLEYSLDPRCVVRSKENALH